MKNTQITRLGILVPSEIRLEVYKGTLEILENNIDKSGLDPDDGLCLLLPCILWDLDFWLGKEPSGGTWIYFETKKSFPELTNSVIEDITRKRSPKTRISTRIKYLKKFIKELS